MCRKQSRCSKAQSTVSFFFLQKPAKFCFVTNGFFKKHFRCFHNKLSALNFISWYIVLQFDPKEIKNKTGASFRRDPTFKNVMHCLVFVIKATTNLNDPKNKTLKKIKAIQRRVNASRNAFSLLSLLFCFDVFVWGGGRRVRTHFRRTF